MLSAVFRIQQYAKMISSSDVASFFEPSVQCIVKSIKDQCRASTVEISVCILSLLFLLILKRTSYKSVFLVGGFAASDWLYTKLKEAFASQGLDVSRPDSHVYVFLRFSNM